MSATILKHYTRLVALWPKDALRPNLPFTRAIEHRGIPFGLKPTPIEEAESKAKPKDSSIPAAPTKPSSPQLEQAQINALYSLLENRYTKKYPLSQEVFKPTSNPEHYDRLMEEISRAPTKSWFAAKLDEWKMKIRFR